MASRRRNFFILLVALALLGGSFAVIATHETRLGLDLKGGVELVYQAKPTPQSPQITDESISKAIEIMRKRVDKLGVAEPEIQRSGKDQISVGLPDVQNSKRAIDTVGTTAQLFFYDWEANVLGPKCKADPSNPAVTGNPAAGQQGSMSQYDAVKRAAKCSEKKDKNNTTNGEYYLFDSDKTLIAGPEEVESDLYSDQPGHKAPKGSEVFHVKPGTVVVQAEKPDKYPKDKPYDRYFVMNDEPALSGAELRKPKQGFDDRLGGAPVVQFDFSDKGKSAFQKVTKQIAKRGSQQAGLSPEEAKQHFAVVLDGELITVPTIDFLEFPDGIDASTGSEIQGNFTIESAQDLAGLLQAGALPIKLELISQSQVSATLGKQALDQGLTAALGGLLLVGFFLILFYRVLGVIAVIALGVYSVYFYALIELIPITMTLPGIAGLVLTVGVAADANIVIFERVKEEIRAGRSVMAGIATGYKKGFSTIVDANVVTLLTAFILFILATAGVKGFAFTLGIGTIVSLFTAVLATSAILGTLGTTRLLQSKWALGAGEQKARWHFDFNGASKWFFSSSGIILLVGALALGAYGLNFGIDFESGTRIKTALTKPATEDQVRAAMEKVGVTDAKIQKIADKELGANVFQISTETLGPNQVQKVKQELNSQYGVGANFSNDSIGPTFGQTVANSALIAIIASLLLISIYIGLRFEWKFAVPVLIAVMHDILITGGVYAITEREVTTATVAALLTILGYSLYDTIIVFDRVRENVPRMPRASFSQIVNRSMSEVLTRSLATSFCTLLPVASLLIFGGTTLKDFAFALLVGIASGAYSSIFIAAPVLTHWKEREPVYRRRRLRLASEHGGEVPAFADEGGILNVPEGDQKPKRRLTTPNDPEQKVSSDEWNEMVESIQPAAKQVSGIEDEVDESAQAAVDRSDKKKAKRRGPRNKRHGRNR